MTSVRRPVVAITLLAGARRANWEGDQQSQQGCPPAHGFQAQICGALRGQSSLHQLRACSLGGRWGRKQQTMLTGGPSVPGCPGVAGSPSLVLLSHWRALHSAQEQSAAALALMAWPAASERSQASITCTFGNDRSTYMQLSIEFCSWSSRAAGLGNTRWQFLRLGACLGCSRCLLHCSPSSLLHCRAGLNESRIGPLQRLHARGSSTCFDRDQLLMAITRALMYQAGHVMPTVAIC